MWNLILLALKIFFVIIVVIVAALVLIYSVVGIFFLLCWISDQIEDTKTKKANKNNQ